MLQGFPGRGTIIAEVIADPVVTDFTVPTGTAYQQATTQATVDGWTVNLPTLEASVRALVAAARAGAGFTCFTLNLDHLVKLRSQTAFRDAYKKARFVTADGAPVALIARRQWPLVERTTGADLLIPLSMAAADEGLPVFLYGTSLDVLEQTAQDLRERTGNRIVIAGFDAPGQGFDVEGGEATAAIEKIRQSGAKLCFVLLGAPKQELFATRAVDAGVGCGFVCVGAAADFIAGAQVRAPAFFQNTGLEWLWRLASNPRRLGKRYLACAVLLARIELARLTSPTRASTGR